jgi:hypothetical protein
MKNTNIDANREVRKIAKKYILPLMFDRADRGRCRGCYLKRERERE